MGIFSNLFGGKPDPAKPFEAGDIICGEMDGGIHICKILAVTPDPDGSFTCHIMQYQVQETLPPVSDIPGLPVLIMHAPVAHSGFPGFRVIASQPVKPHELTGYYYYLRETGTVEERIRLADFHYKKAYALSDEKKHEAAIDHYSLAIELIPEFFEAIDNRAFVKMDLGRWADAIPDFELSAQVNQPTELTEFSIGECYFKMGEYRKAEQQFIKTLVMNEHSELGRAWLQKTRKILSGQ